MTRLQNSQEGEPQRSWVRQADGFSVGIIVGIWVGFILTVLSVRACSAPQKDPICEAMVRCTCLPATDQQEGGP